MKSNQTYSVFHRFCRNGLFTLLLGSFLLVFGCGGESKTNPPGTDSSRSDTIEGTAPIPEPQGLKSESTETVKVRPSGSKMVKAPTPSSPAPKEPPPTAEKPVIYLYPEREVQVSVKTSFAGRLTVTYPPCAGEWNVMAQPDGELTDLRDGASLQYLYYEGELEAQPVITSGFVIPRAETVAFLRKTLSAVGLTPREYNDMITYWLPRLQKSPYNAIHFTLHDDCDRYCGLQVSPEPDTRIRVMMEFTGLDAPVALPAQELPEVKRQGFTLVEWGGVECTSLLP